MGRDSVHPLARPSGDAARSDSDKVNASERTLSNMPLPMKTSVIHTLRLSCWLDCFILLRTIIIDQEMPALLWTVGGYASHDL